MKCVILGAAEAVPEGSALHTRAVRGFRIARNIAASLSLCETTPFLHTPKFVSDCDDDDDDDDDDPTFAVAGDARTRAQSVEGALWGGYNCCDNFKKFAWGIAAGYGSRESVEVFSQRERGRRGGPPRIVVGYSDLCHLLWLVWQVAGGCSGRALHGPVIVDFARVSRTSRSELLRLASTGQPFVRTWKG